LRSWRKSSIEPAVARRTSAKERESFLVWPRSRTACDILARAEAPISLENWSDSSDAALAPHSARRAMRLQLDLKSARNQTANTPGATEEGE
jgi:hypothetical protein